MPRKVFTAGEVLAAADVNDFLMDQAVMTFDSAAARGSAIGTATEGMVSYLNDTNSLEVFDGSRWTGAAGFSSGNAIINGAFEINQRVYVSATNLASGSYGFDRWKSTFTNTTLTFTSAPQGQLLTINSGGSIEQVVERANLPAGTYTLSWQGTATARVYNTGATPPAYAASPITITLDGLANVEVEFTASGGTRTLGYVQLELGTVATPFRRNANTLQGELAACQRYYFRTTSDAAFSNFSPGIANSTTSAFLQMPLPVNFRTIPAAVDFSANLGLYDSVAVFPLTSLIITNGQGSKNVAALTAGVASGLVQYQPIYLLANGASNLFVGVSAEL
jgi:hypothetical protein